MTKQVMYFLKELRRVYPTGEWFTATRPEIALRTDYTLRTANRHLAALLEAGELERRPTQWKIINTL